MRALPTELEWGYHEPAETQSAEGMTSIAEVRGGEGQAHTQAGAGDQGGLDQRLEQERLQRWYEEYAAQGGSPYEQIDWSAP